MEKKWIISLAVLGVIIILGIFVFIGSYNKFVTLNEDINGKWSEVENQYQRQADLIPNLVSVVSSSVSAETKFVKDVVEARNRYQASTTVTDKDAAGLQMADSVATFVSAVAESYPVLQANTQYIALTDELSGTQNRITVSRGRYIESVQTYNTAIKKFPSNLIAGILGFSKKDYYTADESSLGTPELGTGQLP